jgi:hypothetical protein
MAALILRITIQDKDTDNLLQSILAGHLIWRDNHRVNAATEAPGSGQAGAVQIEKKDSSLIIVKMNFKRHCLSDI